jgi:hypothetical protein
VTFMQKTEAARAAMDDLRETMMQLVSYWSMTDEMLTVAEKAERDDLDKNFASFCQDPIGINLLYQNSDLLKDIPAETLNRIIKDGEHKGKSAVYGLMRSEIGLRILEKNPDLIDKISPASLNNVLSTEKDNGLSPVYWLCFHREGRAILNTTKIANKISRKAFNSPIENGPLKDSSAFTTLFYSEEGRQTLDQSGLTKHIDFDAFTRAAPVQYQPMVIKYSPAFMIACDQSIFDFFIKHLDEMLYLVDESALSTVVNEKAFTIDGIDESPQKTLLHFLLGNKTFVQKLIESGLENAKVALFIKGIQPELLNKVIIENSNLSHCALSSLCATIWGCRLITAWPMLAEKITPDGMNHRHLDGKTDDGHNGMATAYLLASQASGRKVFEKYPFLAEQINGHGWDSAPINNNAHQRDAITLENWVKNEMRNQVTDVASTILIDQLAASGRITNHHQSEDSSSSMNNANGHIFTTVDNRESQINSNGFFEPEQTNNREEPQNTISVN